MSEFVLWVKYIKLTTEEKIVKYKKIIANDYSEKYDFVDVKNEFTPNKKRKVDYLYLHCKKCDKEFKRIVHTWKNNDRCPYCSQSLKTSYLHTIVSEIALKIYPNSKIEYDIGFKGINNGHSKYDLFIPFLNGKNTLIEFQSRYHDSKKYFDEQKKKYAISKGYEFYSFDHRTDSIYDVVKILFNIDLPDIIDEINIDDSYYKKIEKADILSCQSYLGQNYTIKEISKITKISEHILYHAMSNGLLVNSEKRRKNIYNKSEVIQLDKNGNYIAEFDSLYEVYKKKNWRIGTLKENKCISGYGYFWLKKSDYENNEYILPKKVRIVKRKDNNTNSC